MLAVCDTCSHKKMPLVDDKHRTYIFVFLILLLFVWESYSYISSKGF